MLKKVIYLLILVQFSCQSDIQEYPITIIPEIVSTDSLNDTSNVLSTYLALGDSYTIGQGVEEKDRWPNQLVEQLKKYKHFFDEPVIIAKTGWTTDELDAAIIGENITEKYDLVTLLIGVNNQYRGKPLDDFRIQFNELLSKAIVLAKNIPENVIVVSIPDWGVSPYASNFDSVKIREEIDNFNKVKKEETFKRNAKFVNITAISRLAFNADEFFVSDRLHFSGEMYGLWVAEIIRTCF
jgi:lysophospholipase L1-like esterase